MDTVCVIGEFSPTQEAASASSAFVDHRHAHASLERRLSIAQEVRERKKDVEIRKLEAQLRSLQRKKRGNDS